jgi:hypothetical protein
VIAWLTDYVAVAARGSAPANTPSSVRPSAPSPECFARLAGLIFMPLVGAAIREYLAQATRRAVGIATWLRHTAGTVVKVAVVFLMVRFRRGAANR